MASPPQSTATQITGNISVGVKKVGHSNTRGTGGSLFLSYLDKFGLRVTVEAGQALAVLYSEVLCSFLLKITSALSLHFQHLLQTKG